MKDKSVHRTVRLLEPDDRRLQIMCEVTGLNISEMIRDLIRNAKVTTVVEIELPSVLDIQEKTLEDS